MVVGFAAGYPAGEFEPLTRSKHGHLDPESARFRSVHGQGIASSRPRQLESMASAGVRSQVVGHVEL